LGFGRSAAFGRTPRERGARPRGGPRSALPAPRGRCARICLPRSLRDQGAPLPIDEGGIAQERPLAPRRCVRFVVATTRSATPRSLAARREENALRDPAWKPVKRSHVPCGRCPQPAVRAGGAGTERRVGSRLHPPRTPGEPCSEAYPRQPSGQASCAQSPAARGGMAARLLPLRSRPAAGPFLGRERYNGRSAACGRTPRFRGTPAAVWGCRPSRLAAPAVARQRVGVIGFAATAGACSSRLNQLWGCSPIAKGRGSPASAFPSHGAGLTYALQGNAAPGTPV
jgi:hypothetical protein